MVEIWFGTIERQAVQRGTFGSIRDLTTAIRTYINGWNNREPPHNFKPRATGGSSAIQLGEFSNSPSRASIVAVVFAHHRLSC